MATTYQSNAVLGAELSAKKWGQGPTTFIGTLVLPANTALVSNDKLQLCICPRNSMLASVLIAVPVMDSGTQLTMQLSDSISGNVYIASTTAGQTSGSGIVTPGDLEVCGFQYAAQEILELVVLFGASGAPATAMTISFAVLFGYNGD